MGRESRNWREILERHRRHVELSPGVGEAAQKYALAVIADISTDFLAQSASSETGPSEDARDAALWRTLRDLAGYWQDGSETVVRLHQDDATRSCFIEVGKKRYGTDGTSFEGILEELRRNKGPLHD